MEYRLFLMNNKISRQILKKSSYGRDIKLLVFTTVSAVLEAIFVFPGI